MYKRKSLKDQSVNSIHRKREILDKLNDMKWIGARRMIVVTRMNGVKFYINATMVELIESTPDTVLTLASGKKYVVKDTADQVCEKITGYYRSIGIIGIQAAAKGNIDHNEVE